MLKSLFAYCQGRHTFFVGAFFVSGNVLHWFHRLDSVYIGFMSALMAFVAGHAIQENAFGKKDEVPGDKGIGG